VGEVVDYDILQQKVTMETKDKKLIVVLKKEILEKVNETRTNMGKECGSSCGQGHGHSRG
jgi:hypothetical protein